jgi:dephospho-CoA kinase
MLKVALTGGIATGKSYVLEAFRKRGVPSLDADALAHGVMSGGTEATAAIAARFGTEILASDGSVNRAKLGPMVFLDPAARRDLEAITHPPVYRAIAAGLRAFELLGDYRFAVVAIPLLFEGGHAAEFDRVIVTVCAKAVQLARLAGRGISAEEARQRVAAQWTSDEKAARADFVIKTDGTFEETEEQIDRVSVKLREASLSARQPGANKNR